jgi:hypothetical protein
VYAIKITCVDAKAFDGSIVVRKGTVVWLRKSGYFPTFSLGDLLNRDDLIVFDTYEEAEKAMGGRTPKPWFYSHGTIEIVKVEPSYKQVLRGFEQQ